MNIRQTCSIFILFAVIVIAIMSPIASHDVTPHFGDYSGHLTNILAAHRAILAGDFWPRVVTGGWFYPVFQFYAPFTYFLGGYIAFVSHNPMDPFKFTIGLALILGAWYCYKLYLFLFRNQIAALLGALLYLFSPYLLINIDVRGDFTEAVTQGLLPISLYYAFRLFYAEGLKQKWYFFLAGVLAFYILTLSHLITFLYANLFLFVLFFFLSLQQKRYTSFLRVLACLICALILASWYLIPLVHYESIFYIGRHDLTSPWDSIWLTQISTLLSPKGISPSALLSNLNFHVYSGFGLPITLSVLYWFYRLYVDRIQAPLPKVILWVWMFNFLVLWSPTDFWKFLPHEFFVLQFTYRFLTDTMWLGGLLFVAALVDLFQNQLDRRHFIIGTFAIALSGTGWMYSNYANTVSPPSAPTPIPMSIPANYMLGDYLIDSAAIQIKKPSSPFLAVAEVEKNCTQAASSRCTLSTTAAHTAVQLPILYYPQLLQIKVNGKEVPYFPTQTANNILATITIPAGHYTIESRFQGLSWANTISWISGVIYLGAVLIFFLLRRGKFFG